MSFWHGFRWYLSVEELFLNHDCSRCPKNDAVVAKPDGKWGEVPCAFIELKENARATEAEIIAFCRRDLAAFKVPKIVEFRSELPKTLVGKILRRELREETISESAALESEKRPVA